MSLFDKNRNKTVDFSGRYDRQKEKMENIQGLVNKVNGKTIASASPREIIPKVSSTQNSFGFLGQMAAASMNSESQMPSYSESEENSEDKRKKLATRLMDITEKLEDLSTQIYHLQQRVELLERKTKSNFD
jgi:predicted RNase H-like nuclease (RuvC/YqgF family)